MAPTYGHEPSAHSFNDTDNQFMDSTSHNMNMTRWEPPKDVARITQVSQMRQINDQKSLQYLGNARAIYSHHRPRRQLNGQFMRDPNFELDDGLPFYSQKINIKRLDQSRERERVIRVLAGKAAKEQVQPPEQKMVFNDLMERVASHIVYTEQNSFAIGVEDSKSSQERVFRGTINKSANDNTPEQPTESPEVSPQQLNREKRR